MASAGRTKHFKNCTGGLGKQHLYGQAVLLPFGACITGAASQAGHFLVSQGTRWSVSCHHAAHKVEEYRQAGPRSAVEVLNPLTGPARKIPITTCISPRSPELLADWAYLRQSWVSGDSLLHNSLVAVVQLLLPGLGRLQAVLKIQNIITSISVEPPARKLE